MNPDCRLIINRLSAEYMFSLIMVKSLVAIRDLEFAFCYYSPQSHCLLSPIRREVFQPCSCKTMTHRSVDWGPVLIEGDASTDQSETVLFDHRTRFDNDRGKDSSLVIKAFLFERSSGQNTSKNSIIKTVSAPDLSSCFLQQSVAFSLL